MFRDPSLPYNRYTVGLARGAASAIKLNLALILIPVLKFYLTLYTNFFLLLMISFKNTRLAYYFPLYWDISMHKIIGAMVCFWSTIHVTCHVINFLDMYRSFSFVSAPAMFYTSYPGMTGVILSICLILIASSSVESIRVSCYELFYYTHHLCFVFLIVTLIHGAQAILEYPTAWMWILSIFYISFNS